MLNELIKDELWEIREINKDNFFGETEEKQEEKYKIQDLDSANWAFRKLRALQAEEQGFKDLMDKEIDRIKAWYEEETRTIDYSKKFFEGLLIEYFIRQKAVDPKFKISTPYGKVSSRKSQDKWTYDDELAIKSLKKYKLKDFIRVKEVVNKVDFKKEVEVLKGVVSLNDEICKDVEKQENGLFINTETGEIYDASDYIYHESVVVYKDKIIEGVEVTEQADSISVKVVE